MHIIITTFSIAIATLGVGPIPPATAASPPPILQKVIACRAIGDATARLACFDSSVAALGSLQASGDVVVMDRNQIQQTRKSLFGLTLPQFALFGAHDGGSHAVRDNNDVKEITGSVRTASKSAGGDWIVVLEDGARWQQVDSTALGRLPKPGSVVLIRKAVFNSYKMQIDRGVFFGVRRVN